MNFFYELVAELKINRIRIGIEVGIAKEK